ncbi:hypothetical protein [Marinicrinis lubricantis]|uniref:Membrane protein YmcC n=1 Tax=Marinicrinis lubricantis TaxID=2086470 RepID=A0ABW1IQ27_9BACL
MNIVAWMIVACEVAFWIFIILGLAARYILKQEKLGLLLLALSPVVDLILLITTSVDLYRGAESTFAHGLAAVYIGVSIAFGKSMIAWADQRFKYYITKQGTPPVKRYGTEYAVHYFKGWIQHLIAYLIGAVLLGGLIWMIDDASRTEALSGIWQLWSIIVGIDLLISITYFIWPKKQKASI